jgi:serine phosphatase RsbU (regulator of sigma subunit)
MIFAVIDSTDRTLTIASSGLPQPYLVRGGEVRLIELSGLPLGLMSGQTYNEVRLAMEPGDVVALCSDGVEESRDADDEQFGSERAQEVLLSLAGEAPYDIAKGLLDACRNFSKKGRADDRTVVVLKVV